MLIFLWGGWGQDIVYAVREAVSVFLLQEADLHHLVEESYLIESQYGHYFDWIIVNDDFQVSTIIADIPTEVTIGTELPLNWYSDYVGGCAEDHCVDRCLINPLASESAKWRS